MKVNPVPFEWALRDVLQGRRLFGIGIAALVPAIFVLIVVMIEGPIPEGESEEVGAVLLTAFIMPPLVAVLSLIAGGTVLRGPMEDATLLYMLTRPVKRMQVGILRGTAVALVVGFATMVSGFVVTLLIGEVGMAFSALPGLLLGGFALGAFYGFILSLHRFAIGAVIVHAVFEATLARIPFPNITRFTVSWHAWGGMGEAATVAAAEGILPNTGGNLLVPLFMALLSLVLIGLLYDRKAFGLGVAEA